MAGLCQLNELCLRKLKLWFQIEGKMIFEDFYGL